MKRTCLLLLTMLIVMATAAQNVDTRRNCRPASRQPLSLHHNAHRAATGPGTTYMGDRRQLVVLASFADKSFADADPVSQWNKIFNQKNFSEAPFKGSVHDYFYDQSYGQLRLTFDLYHVQLPSNASRYRSTDYDDENSRFMVTDIVDELVKKNINWGIYDWDADGYVDQLLIVYAGKGMNAGGGTNTIWPHQWWLSEHVGTTARSVVSGGQTYYVDCYCCVQEIYYSDNESSFGTICHEYSHCFGLPDFYYGSTSFLKNWDLMDYGNNNGNGFQPPCYSAHERMLMGWLTPTELTTGDAVDGMNPTTTHPEAYLVRNDGHADEYYIIENRQPAGWDASLPGQGLVIFHVDYSESLWTDITAFVNTPTKQRYNMFHANNKASTTLTSMADWPYPYGTNHELTNTSAPAATLFNANADGTLFMSKPIVDMAVEGQLAFFRMDGTPVSVKGQRQTMAGELLYEAGKLRIVQQADGTVRKELKD